MADRRELSGALREQGVRASAFGPQTVRFVTHLVSIVR
jgi:hypothetical protein